MRPCETSKIIAILLVDDDGIWVGGRKLISVVDAAWWSGNDAEVSSALTPD